MRYTEWTLHNANEVWQLEDKRLCIIENECFVFPEMDYSIEANRIRHKGDLVGWCHHLSCKQWITGEHIAQLIEAVCEYKKWKIYP